MWISLDWFCSGLSVPPGIFVSFPVFGKFSAIIPSNKFSALFPLSSPSGIAYNVNIITSDEVAEFSKSIFFIIIFLRLFSLIAFHFCVLQVADPVFYFQYTIYSL